MIIFPSFAIADYLVFFRKFLAAVSAYAILFYLYQEMNTRRPLIDIKNSCGQLCSSFKLIMYYILRTMLHFFDSNYRISI